MTAQLIHCKVEPVGKGVDFYCSFVYGYNDKNERQALWRDLEAVKTTTFWVVTGDFNVVLNLDERVGSPIRMSEVQEFRNCTLKCDLTDIKQAGRFYTWNNKQEGCQRVYSKIDRVMANTEWLDQYENAMVTYLPEGEYDHCPGLVCVHKEMKGRKPFRFFNMWVEGPGYMEMVKDVWQRDVSGCKMYQVTQKLKMLKTRLKKFNQEGYSDVQVQAHKAFTHMMTMQDKAHECISDSTHIVAERQAVAEYKKAQEIYLSFLRQKAKERWIDKGDDNTKLFHQSIRERRTCNKIYAIQKNTGD